MLREERKKSPPKAPPPRSDYDRDDIDSQNQIATLDRLIAEQKADRAKLVHLLKERSWHLAARQMPPGSA